MLIQAVNNTKWATWLRWVFLTMLGWLVFTVSPMLLTDLNIVLSSLVLIPISVLLVAVIVTLQWLVLRPYSFSAREWILAGTAGMVVGSMVALPLKLEDWYVSQTLFQLDEVAYGAIFGLVLGTLQWFAIRARLRRAGWWISGSVAGWSLGMVVGQLLPLDWDRAMAGAIYQLVIAFVSAVVTGVTLSLLLRHAHLVPSK
jgi:hypothetical protein